MTRLIAATLLIAATFAGFQAIARAYSLVLGREGLYCRPAARLGPLVGPIPLSSGITLVHRFRVEEDRWVGFEVRTVTWGHFPRPKRCHWALYEVKGGGVERVEVRRGSFRASRLREGMMFPVHFAEVTASARRTFELEFSGPDTSSEEAVGLPIYRADGDEGVSSVRLEDRRTEAEREGDPLALAGSSPLPAHSLDLRSTHRPGRARDGQISVR